MIAVPRRSAGESSCEKPGADATQRESGSVSKFVYELKLGCAQSSASHLFESVPAIKGALPDLKMELALDHYRFLYGPSVAVERPARELVERDEISVFVVRRPVYGSWPVSERGEVETFLLEDL